MACISVSFTTVCDHRSRIHLKDEEGFSYWGSLVCRGEGDLLAEGHHVLHSVFPLEGEQIQKKLLVFQLSACAGFGWGRVPFVPRGWCGAVFGSVLAQADATEMFLFLLSLHRATASPVPFLATLGRGWGGLGGDMAGTGDPNRPQGCSSPCDIVLRIQRGETRRKGGCFKQYCLSSQVPITWDEALLSWEKE